MFGGLTLLLLMIGTFEMMQMEMELMGASCERVGDRDARKRGKEKRKGE